MDRGGNLLPPLKDGDLPYRPEQSFFGVGGGTGEEGAVFTKNAPSFPQLNPGKNHASTGRRASMAALSRTRWLELPRKSSSRSRKAST